MKTIEGPRLAQHGMEVQRPRLYRIVPHAQLYAPVGCFACHVYSILELRASHAEGDDDEKQKSYLKQR
ncbi:uncharacterized protein N7496_002136 [Penicillium cataractarum]|uniref:Uncharacterized protein n=1 Tax=Penicillium cataractarum TaxID=2100454 RepID=A0A9W9SNN5_9EURO|nr:uncharacterized protein N7496_002136 [Penicillium cataractarum]KAJ5379708.1 hypothetical protein N7496_002136 [Penicillium cataractarum]